MSKQGRNKDYDKDIKWIENMREIALENMNT